MIVSSLIIFLHHHTMSKKFISVLLLFLTAFNFSFGQNVPSPKQHFGFSPGEDYKLATYTQTAAYFRKIAENSDRVRLVDIGLTEEGRSQFMMIVSSPENINKLHHYKEISQKLARAENISEPEARSMAMEGKAVVWIDGGLHATETVGSHQLIETIWQLVSRKDAETLRILNDVIILAAHANPDGQELVSGWYMRNADTLKRSFSLLPRLYEKYAGHDNNRDFYMMNLKETQNISRQLYVEWLPQVVYNHHQAGPAGSVVAGPPSRDPFNYQISPLVITGIDALGAAMVNRLNAEGKPGYTQRGGSVFSTWYNGGLRTTSYFHNMIGLLTEIIGHPTPSSIPLVPSRLLPSGNTPFPVMPQKWNFRKSIDYSVSLNYAILDYASRNREHLLYNIYCMGINSIKAGSRDNWTIYPKRVEALTEAFKNDPKSKKSSDSRAETGRETPDTLPLKYFQALLRDSSMRDPRGYIIPADQPDFPTAVKFVNSLVRSGISVRRATADFSVGGSRYLEGSFIVKANQAFRPHILDMFEPQDHPNDFLYAGGPPVKPYDIAGWTPVFSMGVQFKRVLEEFDGPFEPIPYGEIQSPPGRFPGSSPAAGYILDARCNNSFVAVNDLIHSGAAVYRVKSQPDKSQWAEGSFFVAGSRKTRQTLDRLANELGIKVLAVSGRPAVLSQKLSDLRIGIWDTYGGSIPSGWLRWIMEQHHFGYKSIYSREINAGSLKKMYDVLVFVSGAIPPYSPSKSSTSADTTDINDIPSEFRYQWGKISTDSSIVAIREFMEAGGNVVTIGRSTSLAYHLKLPVRNALVELNKGRETSLSSDKYYIPGSILRVNINNAQPSGWGMPSEADVFFDSSPVFSLSPEAAIGGKVIPLAWFGMDSPLRSGWAFGSGYLQNGVAAFEAKVGLGKLIAFGPEITFRAQTCGTFKLMFNQFYFGY
jgi:hypothetical protein